jgi:hypothetical protein
MKSINKNKGKIRPSIILADFQRAFQELLRCREHGLAEYERDNWQNSIDDIDEAPRFLEENLDRIQWHILELYSGKMIDEKSGLHHASHIALRALFAIEYYYHDDRV